MSNLCTFLEAAVVHTNSKAPPGCSAWCHAVSRELRAADQTNVDHARNLFRDNPDCALFYMKMTASFSKWNLHKDARWRTEFADAAEEFA